MLWRTVVWFAIGFTVGSIVYTAIKAVIVWRRARRFQRDVWTPHGIRPAPTDEQLRWAKDHPGELLPPELR